MGSLEPPAPRWRGLAGALAAAAGPAPVVTALVPPGRPAGHQPTTQLAAWTVVRQADGTVSITIRKFRDPAGLQRKLRADGVPASVLSYPGKLQRHEPFRKLFDVKHNPCQQYSGGQGQLQKVVRPSRPVPRSGTKPPSSSILRLCPAALASSSSPPATWDTRRPTARPCSGSGWCKPARRHRYLSKEACKTGHPSTRRHLCGVARTPGTGPGAPSPAHPMLSTTRLAPVTLVAWDPAQPPRPSRNSPPSRQPASLRARRTRPATERDHRTPSPVPTRDPVDSEADDPRTMDNPSGQPGNNADPAMATQIAQFGGSRQRAQGAGPKTQARQTTFHLCCRFDHSSNIETRGAPAAPI